MRDDQAESPRAEPPHAALSTGRALVALGTSPTGTDDRPLAAFVTQLIASARRLPAFRRAGRAEPWEAALVYAAGAPDRTTRLDRRV